MNRLKEILIVSGLIAISAAPRFAGLDRFTSIDEPFWLRQSGNFYYALGQREFQNTLYEYHPAVTTMWLISGGMLLYFPEYRAMGQGYLKPGKFDEFMVGHGKSLLELLVVSRALQVALVLILLVTAYALLRVLFDRRVAIFATGFVSLSPFLVGQSRLLNHEAMVALFSLISLLAIMVYIHRRRQFVFLLISAAGAGLAQLTKSSALPILFVVMLVVGASAFAKPSQPEPGRVRGALKTLGLWLALLIGTYVLVWPGMWVAPLAMLRDVYGNAVSYALVGARTSAAPGIEQSGLSLSAAVGGIRQYLNDLVWRTTPLTGLGLLGSLLLALRSSKDDQEVTFRWLVPYALLLAAAFVLLFEFNADPSHRITSLRATWHWM